MAESVARNNPDGGQANFFRYNVRSLANYIQITVKSKTDENKMGDDFGDAGCCAHIVRPIVRFAGPCIVYFGERVR